jgi:hypothetical protein
MNDDTNEPKDHGAEQWAAFQKIWSDTFTKMMQLGFTFSPESAPPEFMKQMRAGIFQGLAQAWDHFLRSPQFLEGTRQWMEQALAFRKLTSDFLTKARHETQSTARADVDTLMLAMRHMETRILDRVEDLAAEVAECKARLDGEQATASPDNKGSAPAEGRARSYRRRKGKGAT